MSSVSHHPAALMVYMEPTSYILDLIAAVRAIWPHALDVRYLGADLSQRWGIDLHGRNGTVLAPGVAAVKAVAGLVASRQYQVVHLAGWGHPALMTALLTARLRGIPTTVELDTHGNRLQSRMKRAAKSIAMPLLFQLPSLFLPGGQNQKAYLQSYGVEDRRIRIAQMTVDVARISRHVGLRDAKARRRARERLGLSVDSTLFVYAGRLEPHKGLRHLLDAFKGLPTGIGAELAIVGDGSMRNAVAQAESELPHIRALGRLSDGSLLDTYLAADALVLPSLFEPWGLVVNEAMAAGLPVIVSDRVGCAADLVRAGETGLIVAAEHAGQLRDAMHRLASHPSLRESMGANARRLISGWTIENEARIITSTWSDLARQCLQDS